MRSPLDMFLHSVVVLVKVCICLEVKSGHLEDSNWLSKRTSQLLTALRRGLSTPEATSQASLASLLSLDNRVA